VCVSSRRSVTGSRAVRSLAGTFHDVSVSFTSRSNSSFPSCTSTSAPVAATGLLMDAAWKSVAGVAARCDSTSAIPYARAQAIRPSWITATLTAGTPKCRIRASMVAGV